jgi:predicted DNA-binding WGR domain protein
MNKKWALLKASDGVRGISGKKKIYEVMVNDNVLTCSWGMAEKPQRQMSQTTFFSSQAALVAAYDKINSKLDRGYDVAYSV